jgi:hypothetical protein
VSDLGSVVPEFPSGFVSLFVIPSSAEIQRHALPCTADCMTHVFTIENNLSHAFGYYISSTPWPFPDLASRCEVSLSIALTFSRRDWCKAGPLSCRSCRRNCASARPRTNMSRRPAQSRKEERGRRIRGTADRWIGRHILTTPLCSVSAKIARRSNKRKYKGKRGPDTGDGRSCRTERTPLRFYERNARGSKRERSATASGFPKEKKKIVFRVLSL